MLDCNCYFRKGVLIIRVNGNLDINTKDVFKSQITSILKNCGIKKALFNLTELKKIDINGVNTLLYNCNIVKKNGGSVLFCGIDYNMHKLLNKNVLQINETQNELTALTSFNY